MYYIVNNYYNMLIVSLLWYRFELQTIKIFFI